MMLTIKTFQNTTFKVDIDLDKTVQDLKVAIELEQDEMKLLEYGFDEKKFIVLMITRPPPAPKPASTTADQPSSSAVSKQDAEDKSKQPQKQTESKSTSTVSATPASTTTPSAPGATPAANPSTAHARHVTQNPLQSLLSDQGAAAAALAEMSGLTMGEPGMSARLASLMSQPHFRQMQDLIQQSPHLLSSTIESLAASDPEMYNFISENPDIFVSALNHPPISGLRPSDPTGQRGQVGSGAVSQQGGGGLGILGQQPVVEQLLGNVTDRDKEAIERLKELGFSEYLAVQAYMACDKDEQLAANLLFQMDQ